MCRSRHTCRLTKFFGIIAKRAYTTIRDLRVLTLFIFSGKHDNVCTNLNHLFLCENGLCQNITSVFECHYSQSQKPVNCKDKRNCITLDGLYDCHDGYCAKVRCSPSITMIPRLTHLYKLCSTY